MLISEMPFDTGIWLNASTAKPANEYLMLIIKLYVSIHTIMVYGVMGLGLCSQLIVEIAQLLSLSAFL